MTRLSVLTCVSTPIRRSRRESTATSQFVSTGDILSGISNNSMGRAHRRPLQLLAKRPNPRRQNCDTCMHRRRPGGQGPPQLHSIQEATARRPPPPREGYRSSRSVSSAEGDRHGNRCSREQPGSSSDYYSDTNRQKPPK
jgi:hypothetical protein